VIESRIAIRRGRLEPGSYRLIVPFMAGKLYGNPTSSSYLEPAVSTDGSFELDLNEGHDAMLAELKPMELSGADLSGGMRIEPPDARMASFVPEIVDGRAKKLGESNWVDGNGGRVVRLFYFDRPVRITGLSHEIEVADEGYVWLARLREGGPIVVVPRPRQLLLAFTGDQR
jgi:hypothetical protein